MVGYSAKKLDESCRSQQQYNLPNALCAICLERDNGDEKLKGQVIQVRAICECLNCNMPLCSRCADSHVENERLRGHRILSYQLMLVNGFS